MPRKSNPYSKFKMLSPDFQGWNSTTPVFRALVELARPKTIIEVGTWKGASTAHMALVAKELGLDFTLYTVDTFAPTPAYPDVPANLYQQFLSNMVFAGLNKNVTPLKMTSDEAFAFFRDNNIRADLIYLDGNHEYEFVKRDIENYSKLVVPNGIMFGDDYIGWPGVIQAVDEFKASHPAFPFDVNKEKWAFRIASTDLFLA